MRGRRAGPGTPAGGGAITPVMPVSDSVGSGEARPAVTRSAGTPVGRRPASGVCTSISSAAKLGPSPSAPSASHAANAPQPHRQLRPRPQLRVERPDLQRQVLRLVARVQRPVGDRPRRESSTRPRCHRACRASRSWPCRRLRPRSRSTSALRLSPGPPFTAAIRRPSTRTSPRIPSATPQGIRTSFTVTSGGWPGAPATTTSSRTMAPEAAVTAANRDRPAQLLGRAAGDQVRRERAARQHVEQQQPERRAAGNRRPRVGLRPRPRPRARTTRKRDRSAWREAAAAQPRDTTRPPPGHDPEKVAQPQWQSPRRGAIAFTPPPAPRGAASRRAARSPSSVAVSVSARASFRRA